MKLKPRETSDEPAGGRAKSLLFHVIFSLPPRNRIAISTMTQITGVEPSRAARQGEEKRKMFA
jgi:hypothetical protein